MTNDKKNKVNFYGGIIAKIAIVVFLFLWMIIDRRLQGLEVRMRSLELKVTAISVRLGIETDAMLSSSVSNSSQELQPTGGQLSH